MAYPLSMIYQQIAISLSTAPMWIQIRKLPAETTDQPPRVQYQCIGRTSGVRMHSRCRPGHMRGVPPMASPEELIWTAQDESWTDPINHGSGPILEVLSLAASYYFGSVQPVLWSTLIIHGSHGLRHPLFLFYSPAVITFWWLYRFPRCFGPYNLLSCLQELPLL